MSVKNPLGELVAAARRARQLTQQEVAERIGMKRELYSQLETGRRKEPLSPQQAADIERHLGISMLSIVNAMGYRVVPPGFQNPREAALLEAFRNAPEDLQEFVARGLGLQTEQ